MTSPAPEPTIGMAAVRSWCGWHIAPRKVDTVVVEGEGGSVLLLPSLRVMTVIGVTDEAGEQVTGWRSRRNGVLRGRWCVEQAYSITLEHGYDDIPAEVLAVAEAVDSRSTTSSGGAVQVGQVRLATDPTSGAVLGSGLTSVEMAALSRYRIPPAS